ncbi:MAG: TRAP transporter large permease subunit [Pseudomonadales bacterium]|nr:TRAP transporter large permease subunit [Pseudomonadales bacterium]
MFELIPLLLFLVVFAVLLSGYPVAISLGGVALLFALIGIATGHFHAGDLGFVPGRLFGIISNATLMAVPLFVFMGVVLEKTEIARELLGSLSARLRRIPGGLGITVVLVGALLAASTGIVGATVVTMGLMSLPSMLDDGYDPRLATGTISATGTLGQIIPPSISLVLLGDVLSNAYQQAQLSQGVFSPKTVSVGDLFAGALLPGLVLVMLYFVYVVSVAMLQPQRVGASRPLSGGDSHGHIVQSLVAPIVLILLVLGSILAGIATPTEAAGVGAAGALILAALKGRLSMTMLREVGESTVQTTAMVFFILVGASVFSLVFRGYGGDEVIGEVFASMPGGMWGALAVVMLVIFLLGFVLDFIEITFVVIPIVGPVLLAMGMDPVWLGILIAINLQTSFLTPPFGFALFYLRGVAPASVRTADMYRGVVPFVALQLVVLAMLCVWPALATWLPGLLNAGH